MLKKIFTFSTFAILTTQVFAGAGGYFTETCVSASGRTVLTSLYSDSSRTQINLIIDGVSVKYENEVDGISIAGGNDTVAVLKDGKPLMNITSGSKDLSASLWVSKDADPRKDSVIKDHTTKENLNIALKCSAYTKEP